VSQPVTPARSWKILLAGILTSCAPTVINGLPSTDGAIGPDLPSAIDATARDASAPDAKPVTDAGITDLGTPTDVDAGTPTDKPLPPGDGGALVDGSLIIDGGSAGDVTTPLEDVVIPPVDVPTSSCGVPLQRALSLPRDTAMGTTSGTGRLAAMCAQSGGPEHAYPIRVAARTGVQLAVDGRFDSVLSVRRVCGDPSTEIACDDDSPGGNNAFLRRVLDPGDYLVIVDQFGPATGTGGAYTLDVRAYTAAANAECADGVALAPGAPVTGDTSSGGASGTACLAGSWGPQLFYTVRVPAGQRAVVTATPNGAPTWSAVVRARASCAANSCVAAITSPTAGAAAVAAYDNRTAAAVDLAVSVASASGITGGAFSLGVAFETSPTAPANALCASARALADGVTLANEDASLASARLGDACVPEGQGGALFYRLSVPARTTALVTATPRGRASLRPTRPAPTSPRPSASSTTTARRATSSSPSARRIRRVAAALTSRRPSSRRRPT
jgi:hypothetical protein